MTRPSSVASVFIYSPKQVKPPTSGFGWVQCWGDAKREIRAGDVVLCPPGEKHWHGATPRTAMSHIAVHSLHDAIPIYWLEHVTDEEYLAGSVDEMKPL